MKFSLSQKTRKGERIFFETPPLFLSPRMKTTTDPFARPIPSKGSFVSFRGSQGRRPWIVEDRKLRPFFREILVPPSPFLSPISISLSRRSLDPIISCPLSGSVCYAIGLRGLDRRAVCFVSLIAVRGGLSPVVLSLSLLFFFLFHISLSFSRSFPFFTLFFPVPCNVAAPPARPPFYF